MSRKLYRYGVPPVLREPAFEAARLTRALSPRQRMLPSYLIIGAQRAGTTSLQQWLASQDDVLTPLRKEVSFFDDNWGRSLEWYRSHFPTYHKFVSRSDRLGYSPAIGEASVYYMFHPLAAERARAVVPRVRIVALVRNPVHRAYSGYMLQRAMGIERLEVLEALQAERSRTAGEEEALATLQITRSSAHRLFSYRARGLYARQLRRWLACFPREQVLVIPSEGLFRDPLPHLDRVLRHIGLPTGKRRTTFQRAQNALAAKPPPEVFQYLAPGYRSANLRLYEDLDCDFGWEGPKGGGSNQ